MNIPLEDITVKCTNCGAEATAKEINDDIYRYHSSAGDVVKFPANGLSLEQIHKIPSMKLTCEVCYEDLEAEDY